MDLWDLSKLLLRRWYFALPMLLVSVAMMVLTAQGVNPDYKSKGHLQMIPPPGLGKPVDPAGPARPHNPWLDLGYQALGNAALLKITDLPVLEQLKRDGYSASVTVTLADRLPLLEIEAIGTSREQAIATVRRVIKLLADDILAEQRQFGVAQIDTITTLTLNDGANVEVVTSKVKRALIVAGGAGGLITIAGTISLDALIRRRRRRRLLPDAADRRLVPAAADRRPEQEAPQRPAEDDTAQAPVRIPRLIPGLPLPTTVGRAAASQPPPVPAKTLASAPVPASPGNAPASPGKAPASSGKVPASSGKVDPGRATAQPARASGDDVPLTVEFRHVGDAQPANGDPKMAPEPADDGSESTLPADATIVLPLPHDSGWPRRDSRNNGR